MKNVPDNNGRVGILGTSYSGWPRRWLLLDPHPALKAIVEQASPADMFLGDDFHHNGAFRLSYGFEYVGVDGDRRRRIIISSSIRSIPMTGISRLGPLSNVNSSTSTARCRPGTISCGIRTTTSSGSSRRSLQYLNEVKVPILNVAGWWDQEDFYGPLKIYETLEKHDAKTRNFFVAGPWNHGGWQRRRQPLGPDRFRIATPASITARRSQTPWFAYWLQGQGQTAARPKPPTFRDRHERMASLRFVAAARSATARKLYFRPHAARLSFDAPAAGRRGFDEYVIRSRPIRCRTGRARSTPTYPGPEWPVWLVQDQRFVDHRPDVLTWQTEPLD